MAKKKGTRQPQSVDLKQQHPTVKAMDDPSVQIQNLKKLNSILLMETTQRRQQLESLLHAGDTNLALEVENSVLLAFVDTQMTEMAFRFDEVFGEREERGYEVAVLKGELNGLKNERDKLKDELVAGEKWLMETENRERMVRDEVEKLRLEGESLLEQRWERERVIEEKNKQLLSQVKHYKDSVDQVMLEKDSIRKGFDEEKNKVEKLELQVAGMEDKIEQTAVELGQMRSEKEKLIEENKMLESHVDDMKQQVVSLQKSVAEAHKTKNFWTLIASATTIFGAAFAAYLARRR